MGPRGLNRGRNSNAASDSADLGRKHRPDYLLVVLCLSMIVIGLVVVYSISPALSEAAGVSQSFYVSRQLMAIGLSIVAFMVMAKLKLSFIKRMYLPLLILAGIMTLITLVMPTNPLYPAQRWVHFGSFSFQSVELVKFALLIWLAAMLSERMRLGQLSDVGHTLKPLGIALGLVGFAVAVVQSDLGSAGVIVAIIGTMVYVAGMPMKKVLLGVVIVAVGVLLAISSTPYRRERLATYMNPEADCQDAGYQACQALVAVGSGGMLGLGLGRSVQAYGYLPEAANDSIFAIYAEKFGFLGVTVLLGIMVAFFSRIKNIAERAPDNFTRLLVVGVLAWLSIQAVINVGAMIGLLPLKGITLPFISYGGTSVIFAAAAVGLVFQVSYYTAYSAPRISEPNKGKYYDNSRDRRRQRGAYHPNSGSR